jgi:hypothetical protein
MTTDLLMGDEHFFCEVMHCPNLLRPETCIGPETCPHVARMKRALHFFVITPDDRAEYLGTLPHD